MASNNATSLFGPGPPPKPPNRVTRYATKHEILWMKKRRSPLLQQYNYVERDEAPLKAKLAKSKIPTSVKTKQPDAPLKKSSQPNPSAQPPLVRSTFQPCPSAWESSQGTLDLVLGKDKGDDRRSLPPLGEGDTDTEDDEDVAMLKAVRNQMFWKSAPVGSTDAPLLPDLMSEDLPSTLDSSVSHASQLASPHNPPFPTVDPALLMLQPATSPAAPALVQSSPAAPNLATGTLEDTTLERVLDNFAIEERAKVLSGVVDQEDHHSEDADRDDDEVTVDNIPATRMLPPPSRGRTDPNEIPPMDDEEEEEEDSELDRLEEARRGKRAVNTVTIRPSFLTPHPEKGTMSVNFGMKKAFDTNKGKKGGVSGTVEVPIPEDDAAIIYPNAGIDPPDEVARVVTTLMDAYEDAPKKFYKNKIANLFDDDTYRKYFTARGDIKDSGLDCLRLWGPTELGIPANLWKKLSDNVKHHSTLQRNNPLTMNADGSLKQYAPRRVVQTKDEFGHWSGAAKPDPKQPFDPMREMVTHPAWRKMCILQAINKGALKPKDLGMTKVGSVWKSLDTAAKAVVERQLEVERILEAGRKALTRQNAPLRKELSKQQKVTRAVVIQNEGLVKLLDEHAITIPDELRKKIVVSSVSRAALIKARDEAFQPAESFGAGSSASPTTDSSRKRVRRSRAIRSLIPAPAHPVPAARCRSSSHEDTKCGVSHEGLCYSSPGCRSFHGQQWARDNPEKVTGNSAIANSGK